MTNQNDLSVKDVQIKDRNGDVVATLSFDQATRQVKMDPVNVVNLTLRDFTRIHSFWRRVQGLRYNMQQSTEHVPTRREPPQHEPPNDSFDGIMGKHFRNED